MSFKVVISDFLCPWIFVYTTLTTAVAAKLFSPSLSCQWMTSRDVVIKGWRRACVTKRNRVSPVTAMVVEPLNTAIQIHQWWEHNPSSLLIMAESGRLVVVTRWLATTHISGFVCYFSSRLWSLVKSSVKSKRKKRSKELMKVAGEVLYFFTRKNFNITDREETNM